MFADDKTLYISHCKLANAAASATNAVDAIAAGLEGKGLSINMIKTPSMFIQPPRGGKDTVPIRVNLRCFKYRIPIENMPFVFAMVPQL